MIEKQSGLGMAHLIGQASKQPQQQQQGDEWMPLPKGKCTLLTMMLGGKQYFVPGDLRYGVMQMVPPFPITVPLAYSAVDVLNASPARIMRHDMLTIYGTGITTEIIDEPRWWAARDEK